MISTARENFPSARAEAGRLNPALRDTIFRSGGGAVMAVPPGTRARVSGTHLSRDRKFARPASTAISPYPTALYGLIHSFNKSCEESQSGLYLGEMEQSIWMNRPNRPAI